MGRRWAAATIPTPRTEWVGTSDFSLFLYDSVEFHVDLFGSAHNVTRASNVIGAIDCNNLTAFVNVPRVTGMGTALRL